MKKVRSALKIANALDCCRMKSEEQRQDCQKKSCPYNNNSEYGCWCCSNVLLHDAAERLRYQDEKIKRLERKLDTVWTGKRIGRR